MNRYVKLYEQIANWEWKTEPLMVALWVDILIQANWKNNSWKGVQFPPGSFPTSIDSLSKRTGLTVQQTRTCLNRLKSTNEITIKSTNKYTVITVMKWGDFQCCDENLTSKSTSNLTNEQQTNNKQITTLIEDIEIKKDIKKEIYKEKKHQYGQYGKVLLTDDQRLKLENELGNSMAERCIQTLDNYCESNGKTYKNYYQAIHNWVIDRVEKETQNQHRVEMNHYVATDIKPTYDSNDNGSVNMDELDKFLKERNSNGKTS